MVGVADSLTVDFRATVTHYAATGTLDDYGQPTYGAGVTRSAIVADTDEVVRTQRGDEVVAHTRLVFLGDVAIDLADKIVLPGNRTSLILRVDHGVRPAAGADFVTIVFME